MARDLDEGQLWDIGRGPTPTHPIAVKDQQDRGNFTVAIGLIQLARWTVGSTCFQTLICACGGAPELATPVRIFGTYTTTFWYVVVCFSLLSYIACDECPLICNGPGAVVVRPDTGHPTTLYHLLRVTRRVQCE